MDILLIFLKSFLLNNLICLENYQSIFLDLLTNQIYFHLLLLTFFSSLCIYFDPKLLIIPFICFLKIITSKKILKFKIFSILFYLIFSLPYIYLIILWGSIIPPTWAEGRGLGSGLFLGNIGYLSTMIAFYLLPLLLFKEKNILDLIKNFFI